MFEWAAEDACMCVFVCVCVCVCAWPHLLMSTSVCLFVLHGRYRETLFIPDVLLVVPS